MVFGMDCVFWVWLAGIGGGLGSLGIVDYRLKSVDDFVSGVMVGQARVTQRYRLI